MKQGKGLFERQPKEEMGGQASDLPLGRGRVRDF